MEPAGPGIMEALNRPVPHTARAGEPYTVGRKSGPFAGGTLLAAQIAEVLGKGMWEGGKAVGSATEQAIDYGNFGPIMQEAPFAMMGATGAPLVSRGLRGPPTDGSMVASSLGGRPPDPPNPRAVIGHNRPPKPKPRKPKPFDPNEPRPPSDPTMPFWSAAPEWAMALEGTHTAQSLAGRVVADQKLRAPDKAVLLQALRTYEDAEKVSPASLALETRKHENIDWKITSTAPTENMPHMGADNPVGADEMGAVQLSIPMSDRAVFANKVKGQLMLLEGHLRYPMSDKTAENASWKNISRLLDDDAYNSLVSNINSIPGYRARSSAEDAWGRFRWPHIGERYEYLKAQQRSEDAVWAAEPSHTLEETRLRHNRKDAGTINEEEAQEELIRQFPELRAELTALSGPSNFEGDPLNFRSRLDMEEWDAAEERITRSLNRSYGSEQVYREEVSKQIDKTAEALGATQDYIARRHRPPIHSRDEDYNTLAFARTSQVPVKIPAGANKNRTVHNTQGTYHHELQWDYLRDRRDVETQWLKDSGISKPDPRSKVPELWPGVSKEGLRLQQQQIKAVIYSGVQNGERTFVFRRPVYDDGSYPKVYEATKKNIEKALNDLGPEFKLIQAKSKLVDEDGVESWVWRPTVVVEEGVDDIYQRLLDRGIRRSVAIPVPSLGEKPDEEEVNRLLNPARDPTINEIDSFRARGGA